MPNPTLSLAPYQHQVIKDLGIDAWYLKPLSRAELDTDYQTSQQVIAHIIEKLVPHKPIPTPKTDNDIIPMTDKTNKVAKKAVDRQQTPKKIQISTQAFTPIRTETNVDLSSPSEPLVYFPNSAEKDISPDLSAIQTAITDLQQNNIGVVCQKTLLGQGSNQPKWLFIIPPPTQQHIELDKLFNDSEQQLFEEVLSAIGQTWDDIYVTPLLKQSVYKQQDPHKNLLAKHLPVLQAEITAHQPKRIFLMGRIPNHVILSTKAPLSQLMSEDYQLQLNDKTYPLTVLPSLHYFLAIPAEKQLLWQRLKQLI